MWGSNDFNVTNGGGFLDASMDNGFSTSSQKEKGKQQRRTQNIVPLLAQQVNSFVGEDCLLFGQKVQLATLVGILRDFQVQPTKATFSVEDHTGEVKAILWLENDNDTTTQIPPVKEGSYVQIFGTIRNKDDETIIMVLKMFPIDDCNIISSHLLQAIHARLDAEHQLKDKSNGVSANSMQTNSMASMSVGDVNMGSYNNSHLTSVQQKVFNILQKSSDVMSGVSRDAVMRSFRPDQAKEVNDALNFLMNEGHAYTTIDADHYMATISS